MMTLKKDADEIFDDLTKKSGSFLPWLDDFMDEKLEWIRQVVEDAKVNGFQRPNLPKTPAAAKRTRKRCRLSTIVENEVVEVPPPVQAQNRVTRNATKIAKHKLWTLEASPDHKPSKKCKSLKDDISVRLFDESVIMCTPNKDVVKKEVIVVDDRVDLQHQNSNPSGVSGSNSEPSLSTDSGFDAKMILEEDPPATQCLNTTFVVTMSNDPLAPNTELVPPGNMSASPPLKQSLVKEVQFSQDANRTYECLTPCKQEVVDSSDKVQQNMSLVDLITPYKQKMNCTFDISTKKQSIKPEDEDYVKSVQKPNLTHDTNVLEQSVVEHATTPPLQTLNCEDGILGEKYVETQTTVCQKSIDKTGETENSSLKGKYDETQVDIRETNVDIVKTVLEFDECSLARKCNEIQNVVDTEREAKQTSDSPSPASATNFLEGVTPQSLCTKDQLKEPDNVDLKKVLDQKSTPSTCQTVTQQGCRTPKGKRIPTVFSPYASESVKKRVAAYEKLQSVAEVPVPENLGETRMTRTKTRAAAAAAAVAGCEPAEEKPIKQKKQKKNDIETMKKLAKLPLGVTVADKKIKDRCDEPGKENSIMSSSRTIMQSGQKPNSRTPYTTSHVLGDIHNLSSLSAKSNTTLSSKPGVIHTSMDTFINKLQVKPTIEEKEEKKLEERKKREEKELEALLKKEELLREKIEAQKRKREERMRKVLEARQAQEKEKEEQQRLFLEEKNQRMKFIIREQEAKQKEQVGKKKLHTQQKMAEVEERRKLEEAMRLAKLKEQEEEQVRIQALRKKEQEEAEKLRQKRLAEEKEAALLREKAEQQAKAEVKSKEIQSTVKELAESKIKVMKAHPIISKIGAFKEGVAGLPPKNIDDYGIDDINSDDTSDDEEKPKKNIPKWAQKSHRKPYKPQTYVPDELLVSFMSCVSHTPDLSKIFPSLLRQKRTSSAVWASPPLYSSKNKGSRVVS